MGRKLRTVILLVYSLKEGSFDRFEDLERDSWRHFNFGVCSVRIMSSKLICLKNKIIEVCKQLSVSRRNKRETKFWFAKTLSTTDRYFPARVFTRERRPTLYLTAHGCYQPSPEADLGPPRSARVLSDESINVRRFCNYLEKATGEEPKQGEELKTRQGVNHEYVKANTTWYSREVWHTFPCKMTDPPPYIWRDYQGWQQSQNVILLIIPVMLACCAPKECMSCGLFNNQPDTAQR